MLGAAPALAGERDFCADRPGLDTPACTVDPGHLQAELGMVDWTLDRQPDSRADTILAGDLQLRYGLGESTEARVGWTAYGHVRERDRATGAVDRASRTGDVTLGLKRNLMSPDGSGTSLAILPEVSIPVGREPVGAGDWSASLRVPVTREVTKDIQFELTPEIDAAVDEDGSGRHLAYGGAIGLGERLSDTLTATAELAAMRDRDPSEHRTMALASLSLAYQPTKDSQLDVGTVAGLDHAAPDIELYVGVSRRF